MPSWWPWGSYGGNEEPQDNVQHELIPPDKIIVVRHQDVCERNVLQREDGLHLIGPNPSPSDTYINYTKFEVILSRPYENEVFSLFRSRSQVEADDTFQIFKRTIPSLMKIHPELCNISDLQEICDVLVKHKDWSVGHLAAFLGLDVSISNPLILSCLSLTEPVTGRTPLHIAVEGGKKNVVQAFIAQGADLMAHDSEGSNVYHYAASTSKDMIEYLQTLLDDHPMLVDERNTDGVTPLHLACLANSPPCIEALRRAGAHPSVRATMACPSDAPHILPHHGIVYKALARTHQQLIMDLKCGGTPVHWANSRESVDSLVKGTRDSHINSVNFLQRTPLHVMVSQGKLDCVVALLSLGANLELVDLQGDTPLHLAAREKSVPVIQALIIFQAPLQTLNNKGYTARHEVAVCEDETRDQRLWALHAVGAERCPPATVGCKDGCIAGGTFDGVPPPTPPRMSLPSQATREVLDQLVNKSVVGTPANGLRVLSLDGGGVRGLILIQILLALERSLNGVPLMSCFDVVAGTSTGGVLALALASGKTLRECQNMYLQLKEEVFRGSRPYDAAPFDTLLKKVFGEETVMAEISSPRLVIPSVLADRSPLELHIFRNKESPIELLERHGLHGPRNNCETGLFQPPDPSSQRVWEAARATGAAPTFFNAHGAYLDGAIMANNPSMDALVEIEDINWALRAVGKEAEVRPVKLVVSVGTGVSPPVKKSLKVYDFFIQDPNLVDYTLIACAAVQLLSLLVTQISAADGRVVERTRSWCIGRGAKFFRFSPPLAKNVELDETDDAKLVKMMWETRVYMHQHAPQLLTLATSLAHN